MLNKLKYYAKIFFMLTSKNINANMRFRADFFFSSFGMLLINISGIFGFWVLFNSITNIAGWSFYELVFIYAFSVLAIVPVELFFDKIWGMSYDLMDGRFILFYLRPLNMMFYYMSSYFNFKSIMQPLFGIIMFVYAAVKLGIEWNLLRIAMLLVTLFSSSLIMISILVIAASTGFWTLNIDAALSFAYRFKDFTKYPVTIFDKFFKFIFTFIIPVGYVAYYPSKIFLRPGEIDMLVYFSPFVGIVFFALAYFIWSKGVNSYSGTGS